MTFEEIRAVMYASDVLDGSGIAYETLIERADTIRQLVCDGSLDPLEGLALTVWPSQDVREAEQARHRHEEAKARRHFSPEAREQALRLVAGGASYRVAASVALGHERFRMNVWRWARTMVA